MFDISRAVRRPLSDPKRFAVQLVLSIFPLSYFLFPLSWGYLFQCLKHFIYGEQGLPKWSEFHKIIVHGFASFAVIFAYLFPGALIFIFSFPGMNPLDQADTPYIVPLLIGLILLLLGGYLCLAAIIKAAVSNDWIDAFRLRGVFVLAFTWSYLSAVGLSLIFMAAFFGLIYWISSWKFLSGTMGMIVYALITAVLGAYLCIFLEDILSQVHIV